MGIGRPDGKEYAARLGLSLSMVVYLTSFVVPYNQANSGARIFVVGLCYCWLVPVTTAWWANPLYWWAYALGCGGKWRECAVFGLCGALIACLNLRYEPPPEAPAFYLWLGAMVMLTSSAGWWGFVPRSPRTPRKKAPRWWDA